MFSDSVSIVHVLLSAMAAMAVGAFWYSPMGVGKPWMELMGFTKESMKKAKMDMNKTYSMMFLGVLVQAFVLARVTGALATGASEALVVAFWLWLGFIAPIQLGSQLFGTRPFTPKLFLIDTTYQLLIMSVMSLILSL